MEVTVVDSRNAAHIKVHLECADASVATLIDQVSVRFGEPPERIRLVYSGRELRDRMQTLVDAGVPNGGKIHLAVKPVKICPALIQALQSDELVLVDTSLRTLSRIVRNMVSHPHEPKYRRIKASSNAMQQLCKVPPLLDVFRKQLHFALEMPNGTHYVAPEYDSSQYTRLCSFFQQLKLTRGKGRGCGNPAIFFSCESEIQLSTNSLTESNVVFKNDCGVQVQLFWVGFTKGSYNMQSTLGSGKTTNFNTFFGHSWLVINSEKRIGFAFRVETEGSFVIQIKPNMMMPVPDAFIASISEIEKNMAEFFKPGIYVIGPQYWSTVGFTESVPTRILNRCRNKLTIWWVDYRGEKEPKGEIQPGATYTMISMLTHPFVCVDQTSGKGVYFCIGNSTSANLTTAEAPPAFDVIINDSDLQG